MSHLAHVIEYKAYLSINGVTCPFKQAALIDEAYTRALLRGCYRAGGVWNQAQDDRAWKQLEKWNTIAPLNGGMIHTTAVKRVNMLVNEMARKGTLPSKKDFTLLVQVGDTAEYFDPSESETCDILVDYLVKELEAGHE